MLFLINLRFFFIYSSNKHLKRKNDLERAMSDELNTLPGHSQMAQENGTETCVELKLVHNLFRMNNTKEKQSNAASIKTTSRDECTGTSSFKKMCTRDETPDFEEKQNRGFKKIPVNQTQNVRYVQQEGIRNEEGRGESNAFGELNSDSLLFDTGPKNSYTKFPGTEAVCQRVRKESKIKEAIRLDNLQRGARNDSEESCGLVSELANYSNLPFKSTTCNSLLVNLHNETAIGKISLIIAKHHLYYEENKNNAGSFHKNSVSAKASGASMLIKRNENAGTTEPRIKEGHMEQPGNRANKSNQTFVSEECGDSNLSTGSVKNSDHHKKSWKKRHLMKFLLSTSENDTVDLDASNDTENKQSTSSPVITTYEGRPSTSNKLKLTSSCNSRQQMSSLSKYNPTRRVCSKKSSLYQHTIENILFNSSPKNDAYRLEEPEARLYQFNYDRNNDSSTQGSHGNSNLQIDLESSQSAFPIPKSSHVSQILLGETSSLKTPTTDMLLINTYITKQERPCIIPLISPTECLDSSVLSTFLYGKLNDHRKLLSEAFRKLKELKVRNVL